jgi:hypothetical protein
MFKQPGMREISLAGFVQVLIPVGLQLSRFTIIDGLRFRQFEGGP